MKRKEIFKGTVGELKKLARPYLEEEYLDILQEAFHCKERPKDVSFKEYAEFLSHMEQVAIKDLLEKLKDKKE